MYAYCFQFIQELRLDTFKALAKDKLPEAGEEIKARFEEIPKQIELETEVSRAGE